MANFDLPIDDIRNDVNDLLDGLGVDCTVDGVLTKIMLSDLEKVFNPIDENIKQGMLRQDVIVDRGSEVVVPSTGETGIVYKSPTDDLVSRTVKVLMCNSVGELLEYDEVYNDDGDIVSNGWTPSFTFNCFAERISARERSIDIGLLSDTTIRIITNTGNIFELGDRIRVKSKVYRVVDINDLVDGIFTIQLASVLNDGI